MFGKSPAFSSFSVHSLVEAQEFYLQKLGLDGEVTSMGINLEFANNHRVFLYEKPDHAPAAFTVLNFPVESIDRVVDGLVSAGMSLERYDSLPAPQDEKGILRGKAAGMGPDIAWFKDPSGNVLSVLEN